MFRQHDGYGDILQFQVSYLYCASEEDSTKYFMVLHFYSRFTGEMLSIADEHGGKLPNRVVIFGDEIGTIPKIESLEMLFQPGAPGGSVWYPSYKASLSCRKTMEKMAVKLSWITVRGFIWWVCTQLGKCGDSVKGIGK